MALCVSDHHDAPAPWEATASFVYVRGHGPEGRYLGDYAERELQRWARRIRAWRRRGLGCFAYFDNDIGGGAPRDALRLRDMLVPPKPRRRPRSDLRSSERPARP